jgi:hypothetical protein
MSVLLATAASEMARAMARPIPLDAPVIITSDLRMVTHVPRWEGLTEAGGGRREKKQLSSQYVTSRVQ